jgi:hypothetical protein
MMTGHSVIAASAEPEVRGLGREPDLREEHLILINRPSLFALAFLPAVAFALTASAAGSAAFQLKSQDATEMSASEKAHGCWDACGSMAACASSCCVYAGGVASPLAYPTMLRA